MLTEYDIDTAVEEIPSTPATQGTDVRNDRLDRLRKVLAGGLGEALWLFVTLRVGFSLFAFMASSLVQLPTPCTWDGGPLLHATGLDYRLLGVWQHWDVCWYQKIATVSYQPHDASVVFFPLYPLLMRDVGILLGGNLTLSGLIVSGAAYVAAITGLYTLVRDDFDEKVAQRTVLYLSVFPVAFFLFIPYSEALFLALSIWTLYLARRGAWTWAALAAFLVGLTRTQGCLLAVPLAWEFYRHWRAGPRDIRTALVPALPVLSLLGFLAYCQITTGWVTFQAQQAWGLAARMPWTAISLSWQNIRQHGDVIEALNLVSLLVFAVLLIYGSRRLPVSYTLYAVPQLLLIVTRQNWLSPLMASSRYVLMIFPAFIVLALWGRHRRLHYSWLIISSLLLAFFLYAFLSGPFVA